MENNTMDKNRLLVPLSIILAGIIIAGANFLNGRSNMVKNNAIATSTAPAAALGDTSTFVPISSSDHILGNPNAKVMMVEYSDLECPYCQAFSASVNQIMSTYGKDGTVALDYRQFPLSQIHPYAEKAAEGSECVAELGGNDKFFAFVNDIFSDPNTQLSKVEDLPDEAASIGIDKTAFTTCLNSGKYAAKVQTSYNDAVAAGGQGTPYTILVSGNTKFPITDGAIPYAELKSDIDQMLAQAK